MKYLNNTQKNKIQKVSDSFVELEKNIRELKDREKIKKTLRHSKLKKITLEKK